MLQIAVSRQPRAQVSGVLWTFVSDPVLGPHATLDT